VKELLICFVNLKSIRLFIVQMVQPYAEKQAVTSNQYFSKIRFTL